MTKKKKSIAPRITEEQKREALELRSEGKSYSAIAKELGLKVHQIQHLMGKVKPAAKLKKSFNQNMENFAKDTQAFYSQFSTNSSVKEKMLELEVKTLTATVSTLKTFIEENIR